MKVVARNALHLGMRQALTTALAVVLNAVLGRMLGATDFGVFFLVTSMSTLALVIADWGQSQYVIREVARHPEAGGALLGSMLVLRTVGVLVMAALTGLTAHLLGYEPRTVAFGALLVVVLLPLFLAQGCGLLFRGRDRMDLDGLIAVAHKGLAFGATLLLLYAGLGLPGAIAAQGVAGAGALILGAVLVRRTRTPRLEVSWGRARDLLHGGTPALLVGLAVSAQLYLDAVVLSKLAPAESVGWFGAARNVFGTLVAPGGILAVASFPALARAAHDPARLREELHASLRPLVGVAALAAAGTYLFAGPVISLIYGDGTFDPAAAILRVFAPGFLLLFVDQLLGTAVYAVGRPRPFALAKWVNVAATTGLAFLLVPYFERQQGNGGIGVALAFVVGELIMFVAAVRILPRGTLPRSMVADLARACFAGTATVLVFTAVPALPLLAGIPLCVAVFAGLAAAVGLVRRAELDRLLGAVRRRVAPAPGGT